MKILSLSLLLLLTATVSHASPSVSVPRLIELLTTNNIFENQQTPINYPNCQSWHLGVETSNIRNFQTVPANCKDYVEDYMTKSQQYRADSKTVCKEAYFYAKGLDLKKDTNNVWIFDLDDTLLSSLPFYVKHGYGTETYPPGEYWRWVGRGDSAPVLPETLRLYNNLRELGIEPIILTERWRTLEEITIKNLKDAGFTNWKQIIFKPPGSNTMQVKFKSQVRQRLLKSGYNIIGNIGDQWADLVEVTPGRAFKLPNPLYYVPTVSRLKLPMS